MYVATAEAAKGRFTPLTIWAHRDMASGRHKRHVIQFDKLLLGVLCGGDLCCLSSSCGVRDWNANRFTSTKSQATRLHLEHRILMEKTLILGTSFK